MENKMTERGGREREGMENKMRERRRERKGGKEWKIKRERGKSLARLRRSLLCTPTASVSYFSVSYSIFNVSSTVILIAYEGEKQVVMQSPITIRLIYC